MTFVRDSEEILKDSYREASESEAPALFKAVREHAAKAGIEMPSVHLRVPNSQESEPLKTMLDYVMGATPTRKGHGIFLGDKVLKIYDFSAKNSSAPVSEELSAVIAHEIKHIKSDLGNFGAIRMANRSPFLGMAAAIGATALVSHHYNSKNKEKPVAEKLPGEEGYSTAQEKKDKADSFGSIITVAKYLAAAAIGLGGGMYASKVLHRRIEFRADDFSAELMGSGKPLARALDKMRHAAEEKIRELTEKMHASGKSAEEMGKMHKIKEFMENMTSLPIQARIDRLGGI